MSYLELLKLASPEAVVVISALVVLAIGLTSRGATSRGRRVVCKTANQGSWHDCRYRLVLVGCCSRGCHRNRRSAHVTA